MQEEGEQYSGQVDKIEQYLLEFAKLSEDVNLRKQALDKVQRTSSEVPEEEVAMHGGLSKGGSLPYLLY